MKSLRLRKKGDLGKWPPLNRPNEIMEGTPGKGNAARRAGKRSATALESGSVFGDSFFPGKFVRQRRAPEDQRNRRFPAGFIRRC
jgi:hypothetical protein